MVREMKDSGIEWIGEIPVDWNVVKVKKIVKSIDNGVWGDDPIPGIETYKVLRSTEQTVDGQWNISVPAERDLSSIPSLSKYAVQENDLLITKSSGSNDHIGKTTLVTQEIAKQKFFYSNFLGRIRVSERYSSKLLWYILNSSVARSQFVYLQNSTSGLGNINSEMIGNLWLPMMSLTNQNRIASFLDSKCAEIDKAVEATKASIEDYKKLRQAIITEAVTKGLDPNVEMKDSGIEWIGEVPKHWSIKKMKYLVEFVQDKAQEQDSIKQYIALENIESWTGKYIETENTYGTEGALLCNKDDVIFGKLRPYLAKTMLINKDSVCSSEFAVMKGNGLIPRFLNYLARSDHFISVVNAGAYGTKMPRANIDQIGNLYFPVPLVSEQEMVSSFLDAKCSEIDSIIKSKEKLIEELTAYRKSLIYEYVTGKKEVPIESA